jgi:hypothetical protein
MQKRQEQTNARESNENHVQSAQTTNSKAKTSHQETIANYNLYGMSAIGYKICLIVAFSFYFPI